MLLNDILRDIQARTAELRPIVDEYDFLTEAEKLLINLGITPSKPPKGVESEVTTLEPEPLAEQPESAPEPKRFFNTSRKRGMVQRPDGKYDLITFRRKDDEKSYRVVATLISYTTGRKWMRGEHLPKMKKARKS